MYYWNPVWNYSSFKLNFDKITPATVEKVNMRNILITTSRAYYTDVGTRSPLVSKFIGIFLNHFSLLISSQNCIQTVAGYVSNTPPLPFTPLCWLSQDYCQNVAITSLTEGRNYAPLMARHCIGMCLHKQLLYGLKNRYKSVKIIV